MAEIADFCVVGGGVAGRYLIGRLDAAGAHCRWLSAPHVDYRAIRPTRYDIQANLGIADTWQERATGLISYPTEGDLAQLPMAPVTYKRIADRLRTELGVRATSDVTASEDREYLARLAISFRLNNARIMDSTHRPVAEPPPIGDREAYDAYWMQQRQQWVFTSRAPAVGWATRLVTGRGRAAALQYLDGGGVRREIRANTYILACHTPGVISLLDRTLRGSSERLAALRANVGARFLDHPQLSFGVILHDLQVRRDLPPVVVYSDEAADFPYRIEVHNAPPRTALVEHSLRHHTSLSAGDYHRHFLRLAMVFRVPESLLPRLRVRPSRGRSVHYRLDADFAIALRPLAEDAVAVMLRRHLDTPRITLLNHHHPLHFAAHMAGGTNYDVCTDARYAVRGIGNVHIASLAVFPSLGLFNPTFSLLVVCERLSELLLV
ncbi:MAG: hypothetical protein ACXW4P_03840 [Thermoanaerobaculia bacterium]